MQFLPLIGAILQLVAIVMLLFVATIAFGVLGFVGVFAVGLYVLGDTLSAVTPRRPGGQPPDLPRGM